MSADCLQRASQIAVHWVARAIAQMLVRPWAFSLAVSPQVLRAVVEFNGLPRVLQHHA
jgi:hypothetical protein